MPERSGEVGTGCVHRLWQNMGADDRGPRSEPSPSRGAWKPGHRARVTQKRQRARVGLFLQELAEGL